MNATTVPLTDLIQRGLYSIKNAEPRHAASDHEHYSTDARPSSLRAKLMARSDDNERLLRSAELFVKKVKSIPSGADDAHMRRHILKSVESFLKDISAAS